MYLPMSETLPDYPWEYPDLSAYIPEPPTPQETHMKIYIAGPMRGLPEFNFPAFNDMAAWLRAKGHTVYNPAELPNNQFTLETNRSAFATELSWIAENADAIYMLVGWEQSRGARAEWALANALDDIRIFYQGGIEDYEYSEGASAPNPHVLQ